MTRKTRIATLTFAAGIAATGLIALAGDLNPPAGPITSTMNTLTEVEPRVAINAANTPGDADSLFKITQPGSYYLTGNITGIVGKHGIEIATRDGVAIDLMGFALRGVPGSLDGIGHDPTTAPEGVSITNGIVRDWGGDGIDLSLGTGAHISSVNTVANGAIGILCVANAIVESCTAYANGSEGIKVDGPAGVIRSCAAYFNGSTGIRCGSNGTVSDCVAEQNTGTGISTLNRCTVSNCSGSNNTGTGISASVDCTVSNCSGSDNAGTGISTLNRCTVSNCSGSNNAGSGFFTSSGCTISNCSGSSNSGTGIIAGFGSTVSNCSGFGNTGNGIIVSDGTTVADCTAINNTLDGIRCTSSCVIRDNTCWDNGRDAGDGAGIHATNSDNRIEGNNCTSADRGIDVDVAGNIIIKNTCSANAINWVIAAGNAYGPIVATLAGAAVNGNTAAAALGSTDPNANFTY